MNMCRVVFDQNSVVHIEADRIDLHNGHLKLLVKKSNGNDGVVAIFAPGVWRYYLWVKLSIAPLG